MLSDNLERWDGVGAGGGQEEGYICILMADSCHCMKETNIL